MKIITKTFWINAALLFASGLGWASPPETDTGSDSEYQKFLGKVVEGRLEVSAKDGQGRPAVITAIVYGSNEDLRQILNQGGNPNATYSGLTALHFAVSDSCKADKVNTLISAGSDVNLIGEFGFSPFHLAAQHKTPACLEALAIAGADIDAQDRQGQTAYFYAIDYGSESAIETLSSLGADPTIVSENGLDIFKWAIVSDKADLVKPLVLRLVEKNSARPSL